tara:strand:- start:222 stop:800 length:579 start_codon:yes stop_codon:yes gene_type:complete
MFSKIVPIAVLLLAFPLFSPVSSSPQKTVGERLGEWETDPVIEICAMPTEMQVGTAVMSATDKWRGLGYRIADVTAEMNSVSPCQTGNVGGYIVIELDSDVPNPITYLMVDSRGNIAWAKIKLPGPVGDRVIEHEIGHALGWEHNDISGHIMNGVYSLGGDSYHGMSVGDRYYPPLRSFPGARAPRRGSLRD